MKRNWVLTSSAICWLVIGVLMTPTIIKAQTNDSLFSLIKKIDIDAKDIETDRLGNLFLVSKTNQLYKYSSEGKMLSTLNYKYLGNITHVDATNPLEIYVFYRELNLVVFLDNNLAYRGEINLSNFEVGQASAIARSYDNGIWILDLADLQLKKMDKAGENKQMSGNIRQYVTNQSAVNFLYDNDDKVFVNDSINGVLVFDVFANYLKTIPIKGCRELKVIDNQIFYWKDARLHAYNLKSFTTIDYKTIPDFENVKDISIEKNRMYLLKENEVAIYSY